MISGEQTDFVHIVATRQRRDEQIPCHIVGEIEHVRHSGISLVNSGKTVSLIEKMTNEMPREYMNQYEYVDAYDTPPGHPAEPAIPLSIDT